MQENEIYIPNDELAKTWFKSALDSLEGIQKTIDFLNETYQFNLYDIEENLPYEKIILKTNIKYTNICTPLAYTAELFLKSIIISYSHNHNENNFNRENAVKTIMKNVRTQSKSNGHNLTTLVEYINNNIDECFKIDLARIYVEHRKHLVSSTCGMQPIPRITLVNNLYENAFINARYLYETQENIKEPIDLVKLIDYVNTLRDCCFFQLLKTELSKIKNVKNYIQQYYNNTYKNNEIFRESNVSIITNNLLRYIQYQYRLAYPNNDYPEHIKLELEKINEITHNTIKINQFFYKISKSNDKLSEKTIPKTTSEIEQEVYGIENAEKYRKRIRIK